MHVPLPRITDQTSTKFRLSALLSGPSIGVLVEILFGTQKQPKTSLRSEARTGKSEGHVASSGKLDEKKRAKDDSR